MQPDVRDEDVLRTEDLTNLIQSARRLHRELVVVPRGVETTEHDVAQPLRPAGVRHVPALLAEPREDVVDVADELHLGDEVLVDLGRQGVDADDLLVAVRVPVLG